MPSSRYDHIPIVISVVRQLDPSSLLDIGVGFGKWGHLFREYLEIVKSEVDPARYRRQNWRIRIDGIEGHLPYITPAHEFLYDKIHIGDMRELVEGMGSYDVIFLGDVIEHVSKEDGVTLLRRCLSHARLAVVVSTPADETNQGALCDNPLEIHRSTWNQDDFKRLGNTVGTVTRDSVIVAVILKDGTPPPRLEEPGPLRRSLGRLRAAAWALIGALRPGPSREPGPGSS